MIMTHSISKESDTTVVIRGQGIQLVNGPAKRFLHILKTKLL